MPGVHKPSLFSSVRIGKIPKEHDPDFQNIKYCQSCLQAGIRSELKRRVYRVENSMLIREAIPAPDADRFRQCYRCGDIVPIYNVKQETALVDFVDPVTNPFSQNANSMDSLERTGANRLNKNKSKYKRKRDQINSIKDDDLRKELSDGSTSLVDYFESK